METLVLLQESTQVYKQLRSSNSHQHTRSLVEDGCGSTERLYELYPIHLNENGAKDRQIDVQIHRQISSTSCPCDKNNADIQHFVTSDVDFHYFPFLASETLALTPPAMQVTWQKLIRFIYSTLHRPLSKYSLFVLITLFSIVQQFMILIVNQFRMYKAIISPGYSFTSSLLLTSITYHLPHVPISFYALFFSMIPSPTVPKAQKAPTVFSCRVHVSECPSVTSCSVMTSQKPSGVTPKVAL